VQMRTIRKAVIAAIGAVALAGSFGLPAAASTSRVVNHFIQSDYNGLLVTSNGGSSGNVVLTSLGDNFVVIASNSSGGHTYFEYKDTDTGLCLQATVGDTFMAEGGCAGVTRQFWFWNSHVIVNLAFGSKAHVAGSAVALGSGSGATYDWTIGS
jgi:hypothetical protein